MRALVVIALTLLLALPAAAQQSRQQVQWTHDDRSVRLDLVGEVEFSDDDTEVVRLSPGGSFILEERRPGRATYRIEYVGTGTDLRQTFFVNGQPRALGAEGRAWLAAILPEVARETTIGAERRIARILAQRGVGGVIAEIERIRSDGVRRVYYLHLLRRLELDARALAQVLRSAGRTIGADGDKAHLLREASRTLNLEDARVRAAYFEALGTISSHGDHAAVLRTLLDRSRASDAVRIAWLNSAQLIGSDGDKASLLVRAAEADPHRSEAVRRAYFQAAGTIRSGGDRRRVLTAALRPQTATPAVAVEALRSAAAMRSDGDKAGVLLAVSARLLGDAGVRRAYEEAARTISSEGDRTRALNHLSRHPRAEEV